MANHHRLPTLTPAGREACSRTACLDLLDARAPPFWQEGHCANFLIKRASRPDSYDLITTTKTREKEIIIPAAGMHLSGSKEGRKELRKEGRKEGRKCDFV